MLLQGLSASYTVRLPALSIARTKCKRGQATVGGKLKVPQHVWHVANAKALNKNNKKVLSECKSACIGGSTSIELPIVGSARVSVIVFAATKRTCYFWCLRLAFVCALQALCAWCCTSSAYLRLLFVFCRLILFILFFSFLLLSLTFLSVRLLVLSSCQLATSGFSAPTVHMCIAWLCNA